ncbi:RNA polymerase sigma factor [Stieleria varia]|uniref:ECF RNA polymerase sigma factor SigW n=1 Tax=Stieleria varia TaxID=2528005 RepID=A0A5C6AQ25_9BACT|nr:sigma-70 family RNA polymerase sigma factor [Stieleria varia]TWU01082.1 ECF RNA polymerase sigma factor SigW [Stieleria varia]
MADHPPGAVAPDALESNAVLAERFGNHDAGAMTTLVARYYEFVFQACFRILQHRQDAEDATQETFTRLAKYFHRWDKRRPLEPWLITIAGNRCRTAMSKKSGFAELTEAAEPETLACTQQQAADALREEVSLVLQDCPEQQRVAFELFHEHAMTYAEIAHRMQCPVGTVKTWVHRARMVLIQQLQQREVVPPRGASRLQAIATESVRSPHHGGHCDE